MSKILQIDDTTGVDKVELSRLQKAMAQGGPYLIPQIAFNAEKMAGIPDRINALPSELFQIFSNPHYAAETPIYKDHDGTTAGATLTFNAALLLGKVPTNNHSCIGLEFDIRFAGPETALESGIVVAATGFSGAIAIDTRIIAKNRESAKVLLLFTAIMDGQNRLDPAVVGNREAPQEATPGATNTDTTLTVTLANCLNKTVRVTLIDGGYRTGASHLAQMIPTDAE